MSKFSALALNTNASDLFTYEVVGDFQYFNLSELVEQSGIDAVYVVRGVYVNTKSKFGDAPVGIIDDCFVNLPAHQLDTVRAILNNPDAIDAINNGSIGFTIYEYKNKYGKQYGIRWIDV